jgi:hypothetical protein
MQKCEEPVFSFMDAYNKIVGLLPTDDTNTFSSSTHTNISKKLLNNCDRRIHNVEASTKLKG